MTYDIYIIPWNPPKMTGICAGSAQHAGPQILLVGGSSHVVDPHGQFEVLSLQTWTLRIPSLPSGRLAEGRRLVYVVRGRRATLRQD
jgi:hypothetical protein